jgi:Ca2+-binding EF-hand superfamily protein
MRQERRIAFPSCMTPGACQKEAQMSPRGTFLFLTVATIVLGVVTHAQKASVPKQATKDSLAQQNVKELLLLMDVDKNGKISKQEWMKFMQAEFDKLDKEKKGELDRKELLQSNISVHHVRTSDLGK